MTTPGSDEIVLTQDEILAEGESLARAALGVSAAEAWQRIAAGEYAGTLLASRLTQLRFLLGENDNQPTPHTQAAE